jgi:hypothetical protein
MYTFIVDGGWRGRMDGRRGGRDGYGWMDGTRNGWMD